MTQWNPFDQQRSRPELGIIDPPLGRFQVINRIEIPKSDMSYDVAVQTVYQLDKIYNPFAIYPDRGAGEYQIEMLRKVLGEKVKGVHFGGSHEVRDPISRTFERKPIKPFLVNQTTLLLERGQLRIPHRQTDEMIARQMESYQVVRVSEKTSEPTYTNKDEHALDALMLSLFAFINEKPEIAKSIDKVDPATKILTMKQHYVDPLKAMFSKQSAPAKSQWDEPGVAPMRRVDVGQKPKPRGTGRNADTAWGSRGRSGFKGRSRF